MQEPALLAALFVDHSAAKLRQMASVIEMCVAMLDEAQLARAPHPASNSIANLILHLCGNVRQWIGSTLGGQPDTRQRELEFVALKAASRGALLDLLRATMDEAEGVLRTLDAARLATTVETQDGPLPVLRVVYQVVGHFQQHTGQIIYATKLMTGRDLALYRPRLPS
jgi:uncharacterized damage-inducible protein DinB